MSKYQSNSVEDSVLINNANRKGPSLKKVLMECLANWRWVLASVVFFVSVTILYVLVTTPVYERSAAVAIKEDSDGNSTSRGLDVSGAFSGMGFFKSSSILENEIAMLESPDMMENVVRQLKLNVLYEQREDLRDMVLYGSDLPIEVTFDKIPEKDNVSLKVEVKPDGKILLYDMRNNTKDKKKKYKNTITTKFNQTVKTPIGTLTVTPTAVYDPSEEIVIKVSRTSVRNAADAYSKQLKVTHKDTDGTVVGLSIEDPSIQKADAILYTLIDCYNRDWIEGKNAVALTTIEFINDRLISLESELSAVDSDIAKYKSANMIPIPSAASQMAMEGNESTTQKLMGLSSQLLLTKYIRDYVKHNATGDNMLPINTGISNGSIEELMAQYNSLLNQRASMLARGVEGHPQVEDIDRKIANTRDYLIMSIDNHLSYLNQSISNLQGYQGGLQEQIGASPEQSRYLMTIGRSQKVKESLFVYLLQKRQENELSQAYTSPNTSMIKRPCGKDKPVWPRALILLAVGLFMGFFVPVTWAYFKLTNDTRIRTREDLANLKAPIIGDVPLAKPLVKRTLLRRIKYLWRKLTRKEDTISTESSLRGLPQSGASKNVVGKKGFEYQGVLVKDGDRDVMNEAFRVLRTNLRFTLRGRGKSDVMDSQALSITSFSPGSGKTFVTVNLGCALALKGARVILIDADMRRSTLSTYAGSPRHGLSDYLSDDSSDLNSLIKEGTNLPDVPDSLDILPAGTIPPNPTELLENGRMVELMAELKKNYDYILIDCPPAEVMADARLINEVVDKTIFVVRYGLLDKSFIDVINNLYAENEYKNISIILNGSKTAGGLYGDGHSKSYSNYNY